MAPKGCKLEYVMFIVACIILKWPLQYTICDVYNDIYYVTMIIKNVQYVAFIVAYITLQWSLQYIICDVYRGVYYITMTITMYNIWRLLWHILHYNDHYNGQYVMFIVVYITLLQPLQCAIVVQFSFAEGRTCCLSVRMKVMIGSAIYSQHQGRRECASTEDLLHIHTHAISL